MFRACNQQSIMEYNEYRRNQEEVVLASIFGLEGKLGIAVSCWLIWIFFARTRTKIKP